MRFPTIIAAPVISLVLLTLPCAAPAQNQPSASEADSAAIKQVCADFSENFSRHDAHGVAMTFAEDADFTNMGGRHSHGRADIEKWFASLFHGQSERLAAHRHREKHSLFHSGIGGCRCRHRHHRNENGRTDRRFRPARA